MSLDLNALAAETEIPLAKLKAWNRSSSAVLSIEERYRVAVVTGMPLASMLTSTERRRAFSEGALCTCEASSVGGRAIIFTGGHTIEAFCTPELHEAISGLALAPRENPPTFHDQFVRLDCASGITHIVSTGKIRRIEISDESEHQRSHAFHPEFQLAISGAFSGLGVDSNFTESICSARTRRVASLQSLIEDDLACLHLSDGNTQRFPIDSDEHSCLCKTIREVFSEALGLTCNFFPITLEDADYQTFFRAEDIDFVSVPTEHLARHA